MMHNITLAALTFIMCSGVSFAQASNASNVSSMRYKGTLAIGLPLVGRFSSTSSPLNSTLSSGLWGWPTQYRQSATQSAFEKPTVIAGQAPTGDVISVPEASVNSTVMVIDQAGANMQGAGCTVVEDGTLDVSCLASGVYTIVVQNGSQTTWHRVLVVK